MYFPKSPYGPYSRARWSVGTGLGEVAIGLIYQEAGVPWLPSEMVSFFFAGETESQAKQLRSDRCLGLI